MAKALTRRCATPNCNELIRVCYKYCDDCREQRKAQNGWGTEAEMRFIDGLGSWGFFPRERPQLLRGYLKGSLLRGNWGQIDGQKVIDRVESELGI